MPQQPLFVGQPVLVVVDVQKGDTVSEDTGIPQMPGYQQVITNTEAIVAAARRGGVPVIFVQEVHRPSGVDFGRELDGFEGVHCVDGWESTELVDSLRPTADTSSEFHIVKRRYSAFIGTEIEIILRGLKAETLVLVGGLTDVCVHYTFADAHQRDFYTRVVTDAVGGSTLARHTASLDAMEYLQTGACRTTAEIVAAFDSLTSTHASTHDTSLLEAAR